jgi:methyl-accepting chemotaxis protein
MTVKKSMTAKFLAALFVILLVGQSLGAVILILNNRSALANSLENRMKRAAAIVAEMSAGPLRSNDYAPIDASLRELMRDEDITSVRILEAGGKVVKESEKKRIDRPLSASANPFLLKKNMFVSVPVIAGNRRIGQVSIGYSPESINGEIANSVITISVYQILMLIIVCVGMAVLFGRNIKMPVASINAAIEKITMGELRTEIPDLGENEIGSIARGIAFLSERLSETIAKLHSTAVNVSVAIRQVDATYRNAISGTRKQSEAVKEIAKSIQDASRAHAETNEDIERLAALSMENVSSLIELKATAEEITSNTQRLFKATEDSYSFVAQMTQTAKEISKNSGEALVAVEDTFASVGEIGASIREVEEHARESSKMAEKVKEVTSEGGMLAIVNAVEGMEKISAEVKKYSETVERLGTRSTDIEKVLSVIKDVTEQTNLLSLNAAILAAQAGEHGKSFSVIADEIRALSERTSTSTREIGGIVKTIQRDIRDAVSSSESAKVKVDEGNSLVMKVGDALREILIAAEHSTEMTKAIERATEEQSLGLRQISVVIEDIRKMMNSIAKSTGGQDNALSYLLEGVGEVKEVADISKRGTEEQAIGTRRISKNLELANDRLTSIGQAVLSQKKLNQDIIGAMDQITGVGAATIRDMEEVSLSLKTLFDEIELLKKEMEVFKIA